jgi:two-component system, cell cycle sensor histidine kinase and response regulator CckA
MTGLVREQATILVADDDPDMLRVTAAILNRSGYRVLTAMNAEAALKVFEEAPHAIQLVISDVVMPGMKGPQLIRSIKSLSPSTATLLMSGTLGIAFDANAASIEKPFGMPALVAKVQDLLAGCDFAKIDLERSIVRSQRPAANGDDVKHASSHPFDEIEHPL